MPVVIACIKGENVFRRMASRVRGFLGGIVRQIMDVEDIAGGEDAGDIGLQGVVDDGPSGDGGDCLLYTSDAADEL